MKTNLKAVKSSFVLVGALALLSSGCFSVPSQKRVVSSTTPATEQDTKDTVALDFAVVAPVQTAAVLNFRGVAKSFESLTGSAITEMVTGDPSVTNDLTTYSLTGGTDTITATMLLNKTRLAAGLCLAMVKKERAMPAAARKYFTGFNFAMPSQNQNMDTGIKDAGRRIASTFCALDATQPQAQSPAETLEDMVSREVRSSFAATDSLDNRTEYGAVNQFYTNVVDSALMTCTAFLSSACAIINN